MDTENRKQKTKNNVFFDGDCNFCRKSVAWAAERDKSNSFRFQAYQLADIPDAMKKACERAVHVVTNEGEILKAEQASLFILEHCGWGFIARFLRYPPFSWVARGVYYLIAHNRDFFSKFIFRKS